LIPKKNISLKWTPHFSTQINDNRPQYEACGNKPHKLCSYSYEPRTEVYCFRLNFNTSKLVYFILFCKIFTGRNKKGLYKMVDWLSDHERQTRGPQIIPPIKLELSNADFTVCYPFLRLINLISIVTLQKLEFLFSR